MQQLGMMKTGKVFRKKGAIVLILAFIVISAFLIRAYKLDSEELWLDEGVSVYHDSKSVMHAAEWSINDDYLPLYHVLLASWIKLFGTSTYSTRLLSVIFGTASVVLIYFIASLLFGKRAGIYSSL